MIYKGTIPISSPKWNIRCVTTDRTNIDHSIAVFHEGATAAPSSIKVCLCYVGNDVPFDWYVHSREVPENEIDQILVVLLAEVLDERL
jgi:hypothetical protein